MDHTTINPEDRLFDQTSLDFDQSNFIEIPEEGLLNFLKDLYEPLDTTPLLPSIQMEEGEVDAEIFSQGYQPSSLFDENPTLVTEVKKSSEDSSPTEVLDETKRSPLCSMKNTRPDIENRKVLRLVKKFFYQLFLYHNDKLQNRRFTNVPSGETLQALEQFSTVYLSQTPTESMAEFLFKFLNLNSSDACQLDSQAAKDGRKGFECSHRYRSLNFQRLCKSEHFRYLVTCFIELRNTPMPSVVVLHKGWAWENQYHIGVKKLEMVLSRLLYKELSESIENSLNKVYQHCMKMPITSCSDSNQ
ncbi:unnamed protein product [Moneuplotes crassus]|uniref:Uncharacterized protein n=1 Tax=Euplotes crassus TaxID=5936 RepID=A0AAD2CVZ5_EUPCR|nr:unnamed protein product [Moneuplotes crassus]